jgi:ubiquitin-like domain-containing CTD phosphatase 1
VFVFYDIVIWSQTNWHWLDLKLNELNLLNSPDFKICFALDKLSMFSLKQISVKPLQVIWNFSPERWSASNTVHVDDLARNFELNPQSGVLVKPFYIDNPPNASGHGSAQTNMNIKNGAGDSQHSEADSAHNPLQYEKDDELALLGKYLVRIAKAKSDFRQLNHATWREQVGALSGSDAVVVGDSVQ